jgi:hypothetical protein
VLLQKPKRTIVSRENEQPVKREEREKKRKREAERERERERVLRLG